MKTIAKVGILLALTGCLLTSCAGQYYVTTYPSEPVYVRPVSPYTDAVWIDGEWMWRGGRYTYINGYWAHPRANRVWVRGSWQSSSRGYTWRRGYWR